MGRGWIVVVASALVLGCDEDIAGPDVRPDLEFAFGFANGVNGWSAGVADYRADAFESLEFEAGHVPAQGAAPAGLRVASNNPSDDVFMFIKARVTGFEPAATYRVEFDVRFGTNSPSGCMGIGGAPGESVFVKAGASATEPAPIHVASPEVPGGFYVTMNIDHGIQGNDGADAMIIGDVGNGTDCQPGWRMKQLASPRPMEVTSDANGGIWLMVGTDSGFEGRTELIYTSVRASFWRGGVAG